MKKWIALLLVASFALTLCACSSKNNRISEKDGVKIYSFGTEEDLKKMPQEENPLDAKKIYQSLTIDETLFAGEYKLSKHGEKDLENFAKKATFMEIVYCPDYYVEERTRMVSSLPVQIAAGPASCAFARYNKDVSWADVSFVDEDGDRLSVPCAYSVSGNTVTFTPAIYCEVTRDESYNPIRFDYELGDKSLTYTFEIGGYSLSLTNEDGTVDLVSNYFCEDSSSVYLSGYLAQDAQGIEDIDWFSASIYSDGDSSVYFDSPTDRYLHVRAAKVYEDGRMTLFWMDKDEEGNEQEHLYHLVYLPGNGYSCVLTDGANLYRYTDTYFTRGSSILESSLSEEERLQLDSMGEDKIEQIVETRANLLADLAAAYETAGLTVHIDEKTGEIAMDSSVLFALNESAIGADGQAFLKDFLQVYTDVVFNEKYADFISTIMVEGHTDTSGDYDLNMELSKARAQSVLDYCLTQGGEHTQALTDMMQAVGYSYDKPVYNADGTVNMDASRRVSFRFLINLTQ